MNNDVQAQTDKTATLLKELEENKIQLQKITAEHNALLDSIDEMLWSIDVSSSQMNVSSACEKLFGYTRDELSDIQDFWKRFIHPADQRMLEKDTEQLAMGITVKRQFRIIHKDGSIKWMESKMTPTLNETGDLIQISGITRDITKDKKTRKALMESEFIFRQFFDGAHEAILVLDTQTGVMSDYNKNALELFKYTGSEMLTKSPASLSPEYQPNGLSSISLAEEHVKSCIDGYRPFFEWTFYDSAGTAIPCEVRLSLITAFGRKLIRGSIIDITERKNAENEIKALNESLEAKVKERTAELMDANRELDAFNCTVSHDLQAPLRAVSGFSQLLLAHYLDKLDEEGKEMLQIVHSSTIRMSKLIKELLEFAKLGKETCNNAVVNMAEVVQEVVDDVQFNQPSCRAEINIKNLDRSVCDEHLIRQVWVNLISNAAKYSSKKEKPVIEIGSNRDNGQVTYYVKDNGAGFDMKYAEKLFGVFTRLHSDEEFEGTGVGLATVYRIVTRQGGRIWADAKPQQGATFYFTLAA